MCRLYPGWGLKTFKRRHPCRGEIKNWKPKGRNATFGADASARSDYEKYWEKNLYRYILLELYSCGASYSINNCAEAAKQEISAGARHRQGRPSSEGQCEDMGVTRLRASFSAERERCWENEAIINVLADSHERDRERAMSKAMKIRLESDLHTLRVEVDRLQASEAEARSERDRALAERVTSAAQIKELRAKVRGFEASMQSGATVASIPPLLSLGKERALIHDQYGNCIDRMEMRHEREVTALQGRLDQYR